jgi:hypothetical protein
MGKAQQSEWAKAVEASKKPVKAKAPKKAKKTGSSSS